MQLHMPLQLLCMALSQLFFMTNTVNSQPNDDLSYLECVLTEFANDLSGGNKNLIKRTKELVRNPPNSLGEIGFYGAEDAPDGERAVRSVITMLGREQLIYGFEDKYINEMYEVFIQEGALTEASQDPDIMVYKGDEFEHMFTQAYEGERSGPAAVKALNLYIYSKFASYTAAIERVFRNEIKGLMYIEIPLGDTLHFAVVSSEIASTWKNTILYQDGSVRFAITDPQWDLYWNFLTYAWDIDLPGFPPPVAKFDDSQLRNYKACR